MLLRLLLMFLNNRSHKIDEVHGCCFFLGVLSLTRMERLYRFRLRTFILVEKKLSLYFFALLKLNMLLALVDL